MLEIFPTQVCVLPHKAMTVKWLDLLWVEIVKDNSETMVT
jgi:hypothetical protein